MNDHTQEKLIEKLSEISEHLAGIKNILAKPQPLYNNNKQIGTLRDFSSSELMAEFQRRDGC